MRSLALLVRSHMVDTPLSFLSSKCGSVSAGNYSKQNGTARVIKTLCPEDCLSKSGSVVHRPSLASREPNQFTFFSGFKNGLVHLGHSQFIGANFLHLVISSPKLTPRP